MTGLSGVGSSRAAPLSMCRQMAASSATSELLTTYTAIPLVGLVASEGLPFPLYLRTAARTWVLYQPRGTVLDESHIGRLRSEGVPGLFIEDRDRAAYSRRVEAEVASILRDKSVPLQRRCDVLHGVAAEVASDLLAPRPEAADVVRAQRLMMTTSGLLLREQQSFHAVRRVLRAADGVASHSLNVAFLSMGLAQKVLTGDGTALARVGLAGLLHDIGSVDDAEQGDAAEGAVRSARVLESLNLPRSVVEAVNAHRDPESAVGAARVIGLVNLFEEVYSSQEPRVGVYDALRILSQAYRGKFDERMARSLVHLFR